MSRWPDGFGKRFTSSLPALTSGVTVEFPYVATFDTSVIVWGGGNYILTPSPHASNMTTAKLLYATIKFVAKNVYCSAECEA